MNTVKTKTAEVLFPLLSTFHQLSGLTLRVVRQHLVEGCLVSIVLDFESKALILRADEADDSVEFSVAGFPDSNRNQGDDVSQVHPWSHFIQRTFGWGWVTVNQQGYLDGLVLSFGDITPDLIVTVEASSLKVRAIE
jgi:uncharacterized protein DUF6334